MTFVRKTITGAVAALTIGASLAATATDASAGWRGRHHHRGGWGAPVAAGVIGGLALGALAANAGPRYYGAPYAPAPCYRERRPVYDAWGRFLGYQAVRVCN